MGTDGDDDRTRELHGAPAGERSGPDGAPLPQKRYGPPVCSGSRQTERILRCAIYVQDFGKELTTTLN